ncbi:MAG TPA: LptF/LptG family permease [Bacteriovoracaceae bacterium]|nr:LptF/LptG family permease [Bacteriovoracaceae bacterium]
MLILSKLIVKEWFKSLLGAIFVLFLLISTADLINGFLQGKDALRVLLEYSLKMPDLMGKMFPICCLVGTLFSLNRLKAHSELISILAAGYSYTKIYFLIGTCALFMVALQFINLGFLEPMANNIKRKQIEKSRMSEGRYLTRSSLEGGKFWYKSDNYFSSFGYFDRKTNTIQNLEVYYFSPTYTNARIIKAKAASHMGSGRWKLENVTELSSLSGSTFPIQQEKPTDEIQLSEAPDDLGEFEADLTTLSFFKLYNFVTRLSKTGINVSEYQIILLNKLFLSFICLVFALMPVASIFNPNRRSSSFGKNVVLTLVVTVLFWVLYSSAVALGNSGKVTPLIATGIVPLIFFSIVAFTFFKNRKLSI